MVLACFVADDFTGATDALWQYQRFGLRSRLYTSIPDAIEPGFDVIGIATTARSAPGGGSVGIAMPALRRLAALQPELLQYKVCSTFDSSPERGNIGAVIEAVRTEITPGQPVPVLPAQPEFGRWTAFANHFASFAGANHRLDRHDPMRRHPATPVDEADLRLHLGRQLTGEIGVLHTPLLDAGLSEAVQSQFSSDVAAFVVDAISGDDLVRFGGALRARRAGTVFAVGSGGLSYAYAAAASGAVPAPARSQVPPPDGPVLVVSGSCSPVTERQIQVAESAGWFSVHLDDVRRDGADDRVAAALSEGRHTIVYTARGASTGAGGAELSRRLGVLALDMVRDNRTRRLLIAGGDTSGDIVSMAAVTAIEIVASIDVAGLLCRTFGAGSVLDGAEVVLKGGQVGGDDFFLTVAGVKADR